MIPLIPEATTFYGEGSTADVVCSGNGPSGEILVGVEVKKIPDLLSSISTGRLVATQLPKLLVDYSEIWLLTIGEYRAGVNGRLEIRGHRGWFPHKIGSNSVPLSYVESFLVEAQVMGIHLKQVSGEREAVEWLRALHKFWSKPWDKHRAMRKTDRSGERALMPGMDNNIRQMVEIAQKFPVLGFERAWAAAHCFENSVAMVNATVEQWMAVPGVGKVIAKAVVEALNGRC